MANKTITQLTADTNPSSDDLIVTVNDPSGTPANRKVTLSNLPKGLGVLSVCTVDGTNAPGYINIPQNSQSADYVTVAADAGKHIFHPAADTNPRTYTIDSNANVPYVIGTAITFVNMTANVVSIAITTDTLYLAGTGTTGTRSLAQYGVATALKIDSTLWLISGTGLT